MNANSAEHSTAATDPAAALDTIAPDRWSQHLPPSVCEHLANLDVTVFLVDDDASDTAQFSERYGFGLEVCANTIVLRTKTAEGEQYAAVVSLGSRRLDVNGLVKAALGAKRISFAKREDAVDHSKMEFGGITAFGLPSDWTILVDAAVMACPQVVMGAGVRAAKLLLQPSALLSLSNVSVAELTEKA